MYYCGVVELKKEPVVSCALNDYERDLVCVCATKSDFNKLQLLQLVFVKAMIGKRSGGESTRTIALPLHLAL